MDNPHGHHANPAAPGELRRKFEYLMSKGASKLYERLLGVEEVEDMAVIFELAA